MHVFSSKFLNDITAAALASPRRRAHANLHASYDDPCQRLFIGIGVDSYIQPHRHVTDAKLETLVAVRGCFALVQFDDSGAIASITPFGVAHAVTEPNDNCGVELAPGDWHTVVALAPSSILLEVKAGPFSPSIAKELAPWAPVESDTRAYDYFRDLRETVARCVAS